MKKLKNQVLPCLILSLLVFSSFSAVTAWGAKKADRCLGELGMLKLKNEALGYRGNRIYISSEYLAFVEELLPGIEFEAWDRPWEWPVASTAKEFVNFDGLRPQITGKILSFVRWDYDSDKEVALKQSNTPILYVGEVQTKIATGGLKEHQEIIPAIKFEFRYKDKFIYYYYAPTSHYGNERSYWTFRNANESFERKFLYVSDVTGGMLG